jgi:hypothetical protein
VAASGLAAISLSEREHIACCQLPPIISPMKFALLFFALFLSAHAQSPDTTADQAATLAPDATQPDPAQAAAKLHADLLQLAELSGVRQQVPILWKSMVDDGRKQMKDVCELCSRKFMDAWTKQMMDGIKTDEMIQTWVGAYEKHFTPDEITSLIELQKKTNAHEQIEMNPALAAKLQVELPAIQNEFNEGCAKLAGELGSEVTSKIEKEHPEFLNLSDKEAQAN